MVDMPVGEEDVLDRDAVGSHAFGNPLESPPGSTTAPCPVSGSHRMAQFCCKGVTGTMAAFSVMA